MPGSVDAMKTRITIIAGVVLLIGAVVAMSVTRKPEATARPKAPRLNVCVLLDLSDRISPELNQLQTERDKRAIGGVFDVFEEQVRKKLFVNSNDILRVAVAEQPTGYGETLFRITDDMVVDMAGMKVNQKRDLFSKQKGQFIGKVNELYQVAAANTSFAGADIWRFFREDLERYRIDATGDQPVHNVLVVLTDGYITFANHGNRPRQHGRTSYMEVPRYRYTDWQHDFDRRDAGLMSVGAHDGWEVMVLEVAPQRTDDMPIISYYWSKWFDEMGVKHYRIEKQSDSAQMVKLALAEFIRQPAPEMAARRQTP